MVGDAEVFKPQLLGRGRHFLERVAAVAGVRVAMKRPAQVLEVEELRQFPLLRRLDFTGSFAQFRRDVIEPERAVKLGLVADRRQRLARPIVRQRSGAEAVFVDRPAAFERPLAQLDVVLLAAGKMVQRVGVLGIGHQPQIALDAGLQPHGNFGRSARDDFRHLRPRDEELGHRRGITGGDDKIQVAHDLLAPAEAARFARARDRGMAAQFFGQAQGRRGDVAQPVKGRAAHPLGDGGEEVARGFLAEAGQLGHALVPASGIELGDGGDAELFVKRLDFLGAQAADLEELEDGAREAGFQVLVVLQLSGGDEFGDFLGQRFADAFDLPEFAVAHRGFQIARVHFHRARSGDVGADLERIFALEIEQLRDAGEGIGDGLLGHGVRFTPKTPVRRQMSGGGYRRPALDCRSSLHSDEVYGQNPCRHFGS